MGNSTARLNLATSLFLTRLLPLTTGTCLLVSMNPCDARGGDDSGRALRHHNNGRAHHAGFARSQSLNPFQNGFTPTFNAHVQRNTTGVDTRRFDLDLSSAARNIELGSKLFDGKGSVAIDVGGANKNFSAGDQVTAAEYVAIQQVLSQSQQSINVSAQGAASGGSFSLNQPAGTRIGNLLVPENVSAVNNFSSNRSVNLSGDLTNLGSIYGLSTSNKVRSGVISADDINNSGTISSDLSDSFLSSLNGTVKHFDLTVVAENNLNNSGSISSSGALTVATASGAVTNSGAISAQRGDLNVFAGDGNLNNSGVISALNGNLNIDASQVASDLNINGAGGTFSALNHDINVRDISYTDDNDTNLSGGKYLSDNVNLYAGGGTVDAYVDEFSGAVNSSGLAAHILTEGGTLTLGTNCLTGDPTFINTTGNILITGAVIARESIAILAAGNIIASGNAFISTANSTAAAGAAPNTNVTLIAGAFLTTTGASTTGLPTPGTPIGAGQTANVTFIGGNGGNIDFSQSKYTGFLIDTSSTLRGTPGTSLQQENGGNVLIEAFSNNVDNGFILFPEARPAINTSSWNNNAGSVTIVAGGLGSKTAPAIRLGNINTQVDPQQGNNEGDVIIFAAQPETITGGAIIFGAAGDRTGGTNFELNPANLTFTTGTVLLGGSILAGQSAAGGDITVQTNGAITQGKSLGRAQGFIVDLTAGLGGIGGGVGTTKGVRVLTQANNLLLNTGSNAFINNLGSVTVGTAGNPDTFGGDQGIIDITTTADGEGNGQITIANAGTVQASSGILSLVNLVSSGDIAGNGGIRTPGGATITAVTVTLADVNPLTPTTLGSGFGDIGQNGAATHINVDATNVSATTQGSVFIQSDGSINLLDSTAGNAKTFELLTVPDGGGNGQITILGTIQSDFGRIGTIFLESSETGGGTGGIIPGQTLVADTVRLRDDDGGGNLGNASIGTALDPIVIDAGILNVDTQGPEIGIQNIIKTGMDLNGVAANATRVDSFTLISASTVHSSGTVFAVNNINITAQGSGHIIMGGDFDVNGAAPTVFLTTSSGNITRENANHEIIDTGGAPIALSIVFTSSSGGIGTDLLPILTQAANITSNAPGYTNIYNQDNSVILNLLATTAKNQFTLTSDGEISIAATAPILSATGIKIATTSATDTIDLNASIGSSKATLVVEIDSAGTGDILVAPGVIIGAKNLVNLSTDGGDIGVGGSPITVLTNGLSANTDGVSGQVNIFSLPTKKVPLTVFNSGSVGDFLLNAQGSLLLNNIQTVNGSITVATNTGTIATNTNAIIQVAEPGTPAAGGEFIVLLNSATKGKGAAISIGAGSTISTFVATPGIGFGGPGSILILATGGVVTPSNTVLPTNVVIGTQSGGGQTFFGANSITALAPNNTMDNIGADIVFDTGTRPASAILLGGGVLIHADPPVPAGAPVVTTTSAPVPTIEGAGLQPRTVPPSHGLIKSGLAQASSETSSIMSTLPSSQPSRDDSTFNGFASLAAAQVTAQNALNFSTAQKTGWMSDTELVSGAIPATMFSDVEIGVASDDAATADLQFASTGTATPPAVPIQKAGTPLIGEVSQNVGAGREATLNRGTVVVAPQIDTVINTPVGKIQIGAKSLALVMAFADGLAVYDLDDVRKGAIEISAGGQSITMSPGQHVYITRDSVQAFEEINPAQMIGYRGITSRNLGSGLKAFSAEFCVPHAIHAVQPLKHLLQSRHPQSRKVADHLIKTTAAVMQLRGNGGAYQQVFRPRKTAWMN